MCRAADHVVLVSMWGCRICRAVGYMGLWDVWAGGYGLWDARGCGVHRGVGCTGLGGIKGCRMYGLWDVQGCEMYGLWDVWIMGCTGL